MGACCPPAFWEVSNLPAARVARWPPQDKAPCVLPFCSTLVLSHGGDVVDGHSVIALLQTQRVLQGSCKEFLMSPGVIPTEGEASSLHQSPGLCKGGHGHPLSPSGATVPPRPCNKEHRGTWSLLGTMEGSFSAARGGLPGSTVTVTLLNRHAEEPGSARQRKSGTLGKCVPDLVDHFCFMKPPPGAASLPSAPQCILIPPRT